MKQEKETIVSIILQIIIAIFAIILIIQLLLKFTGHSPTEIQLLYTGFSAIIIYLFGVSYSLGSINVNTKMTNTRLSKIENHLIGIEKRLIKIENKL